MGGDYYDRDVIPSNTVNSNVVYTEDYENLGKVTEVHSSMKPLRWTDENLTTDVANPIIFALDVTGSMGEWAKIIYDKMPMFYGQIMMQNYLTDPAISFCAIGDHTCDDIPIQVTEFGQGKAIDQLLSKMVLWKSGNGNEHESYELAAYFYENNVDLVRPEMPFFFVTGDEGYFDLIEGKTVETVFGKGLKQEFISSSDVWHKLMEKFNVFHIHKPYSSANYEQRIHKQWVDLLGAERVLDIVTPKACVDVMLGAIALTSGRSIDHYISDMRTRGQDSARIEEVVKALTKYNQKLEKREITPVTFKYNNLDNKIGNEGDKKIELTDDKVNKIEISKEDLEEVLEAYEKLVIDELDEDSLSLREKYKALRQAKGEQIPKEFICPLSKELCMDPVMTGDGMTFERKAIECWLNKYDFSPITGVKYGNNILLPNFALKQLIRDYYQSAI